MARKWLDEDIQSTAAASSPSSPSWFSPQRFLTTTEWILRKTIPTAASSTEAAQRQHNLCPSLKMPSFGLCLIYLNNAYQGFFLLRLLLATVLLNVDSLSQQAAWFYSSVDHGIGFYLGIGFFNRHLVLVMAPLFALFLKLDQLLRVIIPVKLPANLAILSDLILVIRTDFFALNGMQNSWKQVLRLVLTGGKTKSRQRVKVKVTCQPLQAFRPPRAFPLAVATRRATARLSLTFDLVQMITLAALLGALISSCLYFFLSTVWPNYPGHLAAVVGAEFVAISATVTYSMTVCTTITYYFHLPMYVFWRELVEGLSGRLKRWLLLRFLASKFGGEGRGKEKEKRKKREELQLIYFFFCRYVRILTLLERINSQLVSDIFLQILVTAFCFTVYPITLMVLDRLADTGVFLLLLLFILLSFLFTALATGPMVAVRRAVLDARRQFRQTQPTVFYSGAHSNSKGNVFQKIRLQLKIDDATGGTDFAFTAGPLGKLTPNAIFEFGFFYSGYMFFCVGLVKQM